MNLRPKGISANKDKRTLTIQWNDGETCEYSFTLLRNACPCAECRGGHDNMGPTPNEEVFDMPEEDTPRTRMTDIEPTGSYAVTIRWEDGHEFGIYNWEYLKALCSKD